MFDEEQQEEEFRDRIATVNEDGKRKWVFPKKPSGRFYNYRKIVSYALLAILFAAPHIKIGGEQMLLFNILERKFVIFGKIFWPQDLYLFAIAFVIGVVFIILFYHHLWSTFLWMGMSTNHFHGNGLPKNRVLD